MIQLQQPKLKILDLFSGIGGFSIGLERTGNFETVAFCEIDKFCTLLLQKHWKGVKIYNDVKEITKERLEADGVQLPDIITGGFPCQPFSVAGKQKGTSDDRHLWPQMFRIIRELTPRWIIGENVRGIVNIQDGVVFEAVCTDLEGEGYEVRPFNIPAAGVGAPHRRERIWIIANRKESMVNPDDVRLEQYSTTKEKASWWRTSTTFEPTGSMENARRTLRPGTELREKNEDETGKEDAHQHQRSGSPSESDVADTQGERTRENDEGLRSGTSRISGRKETTVANTDEGRSHGQKHKIQTGRNIPVSSSEDVADTGFQGLEGSINEKLSTTKRSQDVANTESSPRNDHEAVAGDGESETQEVSGDGSRVRGESAWWDFEPDVGRVAHGVPGRVYRLKALGNSIVPKIAQEIGNAIIKAEGEK